MTPKIWLIIALALFMMSISFWLPMLAPETETRTPKQRCVALWGLGARKDVLDACEARVEQEDQEKSDVDKFEVCVERARKMKVDEYDARAGCAQMIWKTEEVCQTDPSCLPGVPKPERRLCDQVDEQTNTSKNVCIG